ncbi:hypothetical protein L6452_04648 [Arctium lappa]|uniref:Uncharacterized protein n=1 Tax=Arctium lappa TaxID=4217 RepID=A0ACB9EEK8_ARCLA|nr:hypothetical protein L6452_04648 [Arctium lappa]
MYLFSIIFNKNMEFKLFCGFFRYLHLFLSCHFGYGHIQLLCISLWFSFCIKLLDRIFLPEKTSFLQDSLLSGSSFSLCSDSETNPRRKSTSSGLYSLVFVASAGFGEKENLWLWR